MVSCYVLSVLLIKMYGNCRLSVGSIYLNITLHSLSAFVICILFPSVYTLSHCGLQDLFAVVSLWTFMNRLSDLSF